MLLQHEIKNSKEEFLWQTTLLCRAGELIIAPGLCFLQANVERYQTSYAVGTTFLLLLLPMST